MQYEQFLNAFRGNWYWHISSNHTSAGIVHLCGKETTKKFIIKEGDQRGFTDQPTSHQHAPHFHNS